MLIFVYCFTQPSGQKHNQGQQKYVHKLYGNSKDARTMSVQLTLINVKVNIL